MTASWFEEPVAPPAPAFEKRALARQNQLTKPLGSLGALEELAVWLAACQANDTPVLNAINITVFAADHGIANAGVSAFPQAVTAEMVRNFSRGGAAINVLANHHGAALNVVNVGTVNELENLPGVNDNRIAAGTHNFIEQPAMSEAQCLAALAVGRDSIARQNTQTDHEADLFIGGEMGIANTSSAAALGCLLLNLPAAALVGPGTGLDGEGVQRKSSLIADAIQRVADDCDDYDQPLIALQQVGGFEIAALAGAYIAAAQRCIPSLIDGFITTAAALVAVRLNPSIRPWLRFGHSSAEPGHQLLLTALQAKPLLQLNMRLGEASGAAAAIPLLKQACALHNGMATFAEAGIPTE